jgi:transposase
MKKSGDIMLGIKQSRKVLVIEKLHSCQMHNAEAAELIGLSVRQVQRIRKRFEQDGFISLIHGNTGRRPIFTITEKIREIVAERAAGEYSGTSCQHMSELLLEQEKISISAKTVTRILKERGIENPCSHKAPRKRSRRDRRTRSGELAQIDASPYDWLSCGVNMSLHGAIDDATSEVLALWLCPTEQMNGYFHVLDRMLRGHGTPRSIYMDGHTIFFSNGKLSIEDEFEGRTLALTQFGRVLETLCIKPIHASSPQAKGRIERLWSTLQRRLPVDMRIAGIETIDEANDFLLKYTTKHDKMFAVTPSEDSSAFLPPPETDALKYILCCRECRKAAGDSSISWKGRKYIAEVENGTQKLFRKGASLDVLTLMDGSIAIQHDGEIYAVRETKINLKQVKAPEKTHEGHISTKPKAGHPWRNYKNTVQTLDIAEITA